MASKIDDQYYLLKELDKTGRQSQRDLSARLGISPGKINFILKAPVEKGLIKMENFTQSKNKAQYRYILTPEGIKEKARITKAFIQRKEEEYEQILAEIEEARETILD